MRQESQNLGQEPHWDPTATPKWVSTRDNLAGRCARAPGLGRPRGVSPLKALGTPGRVRAGWRPGEGRGTWGGRSRWRQRSESDLKWALLARPPSVPPTAGAAIW